MTIEITSVILYNGVIRRCCFLEKINSYIDSSLSGIAAGKNMLDFRKKLLDELTERANELTRKGLRDNNVIYDLIISEHPDIRAEFTEYTAAKQKKKKAKASARLRILCSVGIILACVIAFLICGFAAGAWSRAWLIILAGVLVSAFIFMADGAKKLYSKGAAGVFGARVILAVGIMLASVFAFLTALTVFGIGRSWLIILGGVAVMLIADGIFAAASKQKLAVLNYLAYVPAVAAMIYVILGITRAVPWHPGWLIMPFAVLADIVIIICAVIRNSKYSYEEEE